MHIGIIGLALAGALSHVGNYSVAMEPEPRGYRPRYGTPARTFRTSSRPAVNTADRENFLAAAEAKRARKAARRLELAA